VTKASPHQSPPDRQQAPIRVLSLIKGLGPGGAEQLLLAAVAARDRTRFHYEVAFLLPWKTALVSEFEREGIRVHCLGESSQRTSVWAPRLRRLLCDTRFDIVHAHSPYPAGVARLVIATLPRSQRPITISTEHNAWSTYARPTRLLDRVTIGRDRAVIAVSHHVAESVRGPARSRTEVIVHGIALDRVREQRAERSTVRAELGVGDDVTLVGTVANYVVQKDYPNLFEAARLVTDRRPSVRFCAVGQGPLEIQIEDMRRAMGLEERVILTGIRPDAVRLMAGCDIFVLASQYEGLPVALMEALALGLPVVATAVGGVPRAVRDGTEALLVPPQRPDLLAAAIETVVDDKALRARLATAARSCSDQFDVTRAVRRIEAIYDEVLSQ
jgi:glycosyltransferase involved in cell wall biosynthesis